MTLHVFPDPRADVKALLEAAKPTRWPTAIVATEHPTGTITAPVIQHAWDGTPSEQVNRQTAAIRVTCWAPRRTVDGATTVSLSEAIDLAQLVRAYLLDSGSSATWRFTRGAGPAPGVDDATNLPFCTFTVNAETRPTAVA